MWPGVCQWPSPLGAPIRAHWWRNFSKEIKPEKIDMPSNAMLSCPRRLHSARGFTWNTLISADSDVFVQHGFSHFEGCAAFNLEHTSFGSSLLPSGFLAHIVESVWGKHMDTKCIRGSFGEIFIHCLDNVRDKMQVAQRLYLVKQVCSWRSVWILYPLICVLALQEGIEGAKARCGRELVADLEFVCGDRGFYRGKPGGPRTSGPRSRGKGIVEQCCVRGCDLQHLESYCAKPKRGRRHALSPPQTVEEQFWQVFLKRWNAQMNKDQETTSQRVREQALYQWNFTGPVLLNSDTKTPNRPPSARQHLSTEQITPGATFLTHNR